MGVFIGEAGACAANTPVKTFTWPATETRIWFKDECFRQVKQLPASSTIWFKGNTGLAASTTVEGIEGNNHMQWQIDYSALTYSVMIVASGDW